MENFYDYIEKGGIIFSILLVLSAVGLTLITYKFIEINFFNDFDFQSFEEDLSKSNTLNDFKQLIDLKPSSEKKNISFRNPRYYRKKFIKNLERSGNRNPYS